MKKLLLIFIILVINISACYAEKIDVFKLAEHGSPEQLKDALKKGADFNVKRNLYDFDNYSDEDDDYWAFDTGDTPLHRAAHYNHNPESIKFLIEQGLDVNATAEVGNSASISPLACALWAENNVAVKELLKHGADPNDWTVGGFYFVGTPFHIIALLYDDNPTAAKNMINMLVEAGGNVDSHEELSSDELERISEYETEFAENKTIFLPRSQWDDNNPCGNMREFSHAATGNFLATLTPLMWAVLCDNVDVVDILLDFNADTNIRNVENKSAVDYANELPKNSKIKNSPTFKRLLSSSLLQKINGHE